MGSVVENPLFRWLLEILSLDNSQSTTRSKPSSLPECCYRMSLSWASQSHWVLGFKCQSRFVGLWKLWSWSAYRLYMVNESRKESSWTDSMEQRISWSAWMLGSNFWARVLIGSHRRMFHQLVLLVEDQMNEDWRNEVNQINLWRWKTKNNRKLMKKNTRWPYGQKSMVGDPGWYQKKSNCQDIVSDAKGEYFWHSKHCFNKHAIQHCSLEPHDIDTVYGNVGDERWIQTYSQGTNKAI